ncbi:MAG: dihydrofolate reductase family protein [Pseudomonadota bacterium]
MKAAVYIAASIDGYIADSDGGVEWLDCVPTPEGDDLGFFDFMAGIDALVMGRLSYETVLGFGQWFYNRPVYVWSSREIEIPPELKDKVFPVGGTVAEVCDTLGRDGHASLYIDGGLTVQSFLAEDAVDELIITRIPMVLGGGVPLFGGLEAPLRFRHVGTEVLAGELVKSRYLRER